MPHHDLAAADRDERAVAEPGERGIRQAEADRDTIQAELNELYRLTTRPLGGAPPVPPQP